MVRAPVAAIVGEDDDAERIGRHMSAASTALSRQGAQAGCEPLLLVSDGYRHDAASAPTGRFMRC